MRDFRLHSTNPGAPLDAAVEMILFARGRMPGESEKILPHGKVALALNLGRPHRLGKDPGREQNPGYQESWFSGLQTSPLYHHPSATTHVHGIVFDPMAFSELFPQDMSAWTDATVDASKVLGSRFGRELLTTCRQPTDVEAIHQAIEEQLLERFERRERHPAWLWQGYRQICERQGSVRLERLYRHVEVSGRHFTRTFKTASGLSPKAFCRVLRLQSVLASVDPASEVNWSDLAHAAEYSDQSHFNRDFRQFTGMTPKRYVEARQSVYGELQPGEDVSFVPEVD